jgi:hypothetical protein
VVSADVLAQNTGPGVLLAGALDERDAVVAGAGPCVVTVAVGDTETALAVAPSGDGRGTLEEGASPPAHPADRASAAAASAMMIALARQRTGSETASDIMT